jgi:hypothetical protein
LRFATIKKDVRVVTNLLLDGTLKRHMSAASIDGNTHIKDDAMIKLVVHASVHAVDLYHDLGLIVPCNATGSFSYTHVAKHVTCEKCKEYLDKRAKKMNVDLQSIMKIW